MPFVFCDLNFIVTAHQGPDAYKQHLQQLGGAGTVTFVLSPMHWAEAAEDADPVRGAAKADFMDALQPRWIYERRAIQRREATAAFFRFLGHFSVSYPAQVLERLETQPEISVQMEVTVVRTALVAKA
jgi:hypothetical protein